MNFENATLRGRRRRRGPRQRVGVLGPTLPGLVVYPSLNEERVSLDFRVRSLNRTQFSLLVDTQVPLVRTCPLTGCFTAERGTARPGAVWVPPAVVDVVLVGEKLMLENAVFYVLQGVSL